MKSNLLCIETATKSCSVALFSDQKLQSVVEENGADYLHSEKLTLFIQDVLKQGGISPAELDAVMVGKGPGSYTGLRIGVSVAKGICFATKAKLLAINSTRVLFEQAKELRPEADIYISMIDARRMEAYVEVFDGNGTVLEKIHSKILDENSFEKYAKMKTVILGDSAEKFKEISDVNFNFEFLLEPFSSAQFMGNIGFEMWNKKQFEDVAYFEPFYLKDFIAGKPKQIFG